MPYLIVAKDKAAVDKWQEIKAEAESDPTALLKKLESGALGDYQVPVMYSNCLLYTSSPAARPPPWRPWRSPGLGWGRTRTSSSSAR